MPYPASRYLEIGTVVSKEMYENGISAYEVATKGSIRAHRVMELVKGYSEPKISEARVFEIMLGKPVYELFPQWIEKREAKLK